MLKMAYWSRIHREADKSLRLTIDSSNGGQGKGQQTAQHLVKLDHDEVIFRGLVHLGQPLQVKAIAEELPFCSGNQACTTGVAEM